MPDVTKHTETCPSWCNPHLHITTHRHLLTSFVDLASYAEVLVREHCGKTRIRVAFGEAVSERGFDLTVEEAELLIANMPELRDALTAGVQLLRQSA